MNRRSVAILLIFALNSMSSSAANIDEQLYTAVGNGDVETAKQLIEAGANVNAPQPPYAQTPIHIAPSQGVELVKLHPTELAVSVPARENVSRSVVLSTT